MSTEDLMFGSGSVILHSSSDRNARLWTPEGKLVQGPAHPKRWSLKKPSIYAHSRSPWSHIRGERKENKKKRAFATLPILEEGQLFSVNEPLKSTEQETLEPAQHGSSSGDPVKDSKLEAKGQQEPEPQLPRIDRPRQTSPNQAPSEDTAQSRLKTPPLSSILGQRKHESFFKHNLEEEFLQRIARRTVRRHLFGEINPHKVNRFGAGCSPFHALATTEMETFTLPSNLPMTARMVSKGIVCTSESDLKSMQLTFPELDEVSAEEPKASDRKKPPDQTIKPKLPPLVKASRSRLSENKKTSGCRLPSVPAVIASASLKWGKF
uniref:uncharacterized protein LOC114588334 n=1 Tax=Podarcis muralis TaxID=64176 RepID=UPI00109FFCC2|nr:uncharacterized protein LOC114588334 [Podarcis muralis]XP_028569340.1 uncharacterized protein LOC114588334 [Podarcis muralis]XP_028569351.1 uncharacterized protein LOC114588334 [Podarcis muralis]